MAAVDPFSRMLEHLTEQLRREHQREVRRLNVAIGHLELELKHAQCFPARQGDDVQGAPDGSKELDLNDVQCCLSAPQGGETRGAPDGSQELELEHAQHLSARRGGDEQGAPDGNKDLELKHAQRFSARCGSDEKGVPDGSKDLSEGGVLCDVRDVGDGVASPTAVSQASTSSASGLQRLASASSASGLQRDKSSALVKKGITRLFSPTGGAPRRASSLDFSIDGSRAIRASASRQHEVTYSSFAPLAFIERLVQSARFEILFCVLIALNVIIMALEAQNHGFDVGTNYLGLHHKFETHVPIGPGVFDFAGYIFGVLFTVEIILRIVGKRLQFARDVWNVMDFLIVVMWFVSQLQQTVSINPQLLRLARMAKILRMARLVKHIQGFDSLFLLTTSLKGSVEILGWTCFLLLAVLMLNGLLLNQVLVEFYFKNEAFPRDERREVYRYFGSFTTSLFSMFELTLGNWPPLSRVLYENVSHWFIFFTIIHKITIGFAIISVVNGVFIQETFRTAQLDDELMCRRTHKAFKTHAKKIKRLVMAADTSGEGELDLHEFREIFADPVLRTWLASMEFVAGDVDALFNLMTDGSGSLSVDDMVAGVAKYKGNARSLDIHMLLSEQRLLKEFVQEQFREHADSSHKLGGTTAVQRPSRVEL